MRKLLTAVIGAMVGATVVAGTGYGAGPIYTIPATYEKVEKLAQGIAGRDLNTIDVNRALNTGANVRAFIQGATGKDVGSTYSPTYFTAYGNNYRQFVKNAVGVDVGGTTSSTSFANAGNNYRSLAQGMTGLTVSGSYATYYNYAGRNIKSFAEGQTGLSIRDYRYWYFRNAGRNTRDTVYAITGVNPTTTYNGYYYPTTNTTAGYYANQFKQRADQTFYDMYLNPNGLKKAFSLDSSVTQITGNMKPKTTLNRTTNLAGIQISQEYNADAPRHARKTIDMGYHKVCFLTAASPWGDDGNDCHLYTDATPDGNTKVHWWITAWNENDPVVRCRARCLDW